MDLFSVMQRDDWVERMEEERFDPRYYVLKGYLSLKRIRIDVKEPLKTKVLIDYMKEYGMKPRISDWKKYSFFPIKDKRLFELYNNHKDMFWTPEEADFSNDRGQFEKAGEEIKRVILFIAAFFSQADGIVIENLTERFMEDLDFLKEAKIFYNIQTAIETIHNHTYSIIIDVLVSEEKKKEELFDGIGRYACIKKIAEWMLTWRSSDRHLLERTVAFACVEGIFFVSAFCVIHWIKRVHPIDGFCKVNEWIARDERLHEEFAIALYHSLVDLGYMRLEEDVIFTIVKSAVEVIKDFVRETLRVESLGLSSEDMIKYVECTANMLCKELGYSEPYPYTVNPFPWMTLIGMSNKTNFFESRVTEYSKPTGRYLYEVLEDF